MKLPISIIISTLNEEHYLPKLLTSLQKQTLKPEEIIVADALSTDRTREIAKTFGCKIVDGGIPAKARNNGVIIATQSLILFLDSDVILPSEFLERTVEEMMERKLDGASCYPVPITTYKPDYVIHLLTNMYIYFINKYSIHAPGFCIFVKKDMHEKIKGFDESLIMGEDHNYANKIARIGQFSFLNSYKIPVSIRRLEKEGRFNLLKKYARIELHRIFAGEVKRNIVGYEFGNFKHAGKKKK